MKGHVTGLKNNFKKIFSRTFYFPKQLFFKELFFAFELGNLLKAASRLGKGLSIASCPQSYPQVLWICQKNAMKPIVSFVFQDLH
jgi:hypothetical protein